jgi:hypothetical protein
VIEGSLDFPIAPGPGEYEVRFLRLSPGPIACLGTAEFHVSAERFALWHLDENFDDSVGPFDGTPSGFVPLVPDGSVNGAALFDGAPAIGGDLNGSFLETTENFDITEFNSGLTVAGFVRLHDTSGDNPVIDRSDRLTWPGFTLNVRDGALRLFMRASPGDVRLITEATSEVISAGCYHHVAATWDGTADGGVRLYIDGAEVASETTSINGPFFGFSSNFYGFRIGRSYPDLSGFRSQFRGEIDELGVWKGRLSATEIQQAAGQGSPSCFPCSDGLDNDGDGWIDFDPLTRSSPGDESSDPSGQGDPVCKSPTFTREYSQCQDGSHNDGDGKMDYDGGRSFHGTAQTQPDAHCTAPWDNKERQKVCGLGFELILLLAPFGWAYGRRRRRLA